MKAMIFAAGRGERLKPLTNHTPKPLATIHDKPLIQYHIEALSRAGITDLVINVSWLHQQIIDFVTKLVQQPALRTVKVKFSVETETPLETGGGMLKALPLLGEEPFVVVNADVYTDFDFNQLDTDLDDAWVNLVLVTNPQHNPTGDFGMSENKLMAKSTNNPNYTYSGIGCYSAKILNDPPNTQVFSIVPCIKQAINQHQAKAQLHQGQWHDVGTLQRLDELNQQ